MNKNAATSNDLIDGLVRRFFDVEPDVMAALAHDDEQVRLRRLPNAQATIDPLDGLDVLVRRVVAMSLTMRRHPDAVSLVTERQAGAAGWPTARIANAAILLAWGLHIDTAPNLSMPVLLAADETAEDVSRSVRVGRNLPPLPKLLEKLRRSRHIDAAANELEDRPRRSTPARKGRTIAPLADVLADWLGVEAETVELLADRHGQRVAGRDARAAFYISCIAIEFLDMGRVMEEEQVMAVRLKTEHDARLAGLPGATAANLALLLGAAINHGTGCTVHFLRPRTEMAAALVEAGQRIARGDGETRSDVRDATVDILELQDQATRGYVHVGRRAAGRVARGVYDRCIGRVGPGTTPIADEAVR